MILILRLSICDVTFKSFIDHVVSTLHVPGRRERFVMIFFIIYGLNILIKFQVSEWETTKWRPKWYQRGVHPRSWWSHRGISYATAHKLADQFHDFALNCLKIYFIHQSNWDEVVDNFDDMNLREELLRGIYAYGFEKPSAIQQRAIIPCIKGK